MKEELLKEIFGLLIQYFNQEDIVDEYKECVNNYKEIIDELDDCIFVNVIDELPEYNISVKEFDELLNKEDLTDSEKEYVIELINFTKKLIIKHVDLKIKELFELKAKF